MNYAFWRKVPLRLEVCDVGVLSPDLNVLGLGKSEIFRSVFQLLSKDLPICWLTCGFYYVKSSHSF